jgi:hypothetical protein
MQQIQCITGGSFLRNAIFWSWPDLPRVRVKMEWREISTEPLGPVAGMQTMNGAARAFGNGNRLYGDEYGSKENQQFQELRAGIAA